MRKEILLPGLALAGGAAGFVLRRWELNTAFEPDTGLHVAGAPATWALVALSLLMAGLFLLLCTGHHFPFPGGYDQAFHSGSSLYVTVSIASGFLMGVGGILKLRELPGALSGYSGLAVRGVASALPMVLLSALCLVSAGCIVLIAKNNYRGEGKGMRSMLLLAPAYAACMWLISAYQAKAADPVIEDYIYQLLAVISVLLALYFMAGFSFEKTKVKRTVFFSLLGIYLSVLNLANTDDLSSLALFAFAILYLTASAAVLLFNDRRLLEAELSPNTDSNLKKRCHLFFKFR